MANNKKNIIELLKNFESTLEEIDKTGVNDEKSLKKKLKDFCMKFNNDVTDTNELEGLIKNINLILGRIVNKYSKISEDTKSSAEDAKTQAESTELPPAEDAKSSVASAELPPAEDAKTQAASAEAPGSSIENPADAVVLQTKGGKKRKTKNKKTKKHKKRRTKKLKKKKSKKYRKVNTKKH